MAASTTTASSGSSQLHGNPNGNANSGMTLHGLLPALGHSTSLHSQQEQQPTNGALLNPVVPPQHFQHPQLKRRRPLQDANDVQITISLNDINSTNSPSTGAGSKSMVLTPHAPSASSSSSARRHGALSAAATASSNTAMAIATPPKPTANGADKMDSPRRPVPPKRLRVPQSSSISLVHQHKVLRSSTNSSVASAALTDSTASTSSSMTNNSPGVLHSNPSSVNSSKQDSTRNASTTTSAVALTTKSKTLNGDNAASTAELASRTIVLTDSEPMEVDASSSTNEKAAIEALRVRFQQFLSSWELNELEQFGATDVLFVGTEESKRQRLEKTQQLLQRKMDETKPAVSTASVAAGEASQADPASTQPSQKDMSTETKQLDPTFDDEKGDYIVIPHDHLAFRYEVLELLGSGSFGQVVRCLDHLLQQEVAIKIIRNRKRFKELSLQEVDMLSLLAGRSPAKGTSSMVADNGNGSNTKAKVSVPTAPAKQSSMAVAVPNIVQMHQHFHFRNHLCIVFERLGLNLYEHLKLHHFQGLQLPIVRRLATQILQSLRGIHALNVVHCDLKPENILIRKLDLQQEVASIALIDFGSSCFANATLFSYIQSRFYRSPEVILGFAYGCGIDMWSLGCVLAELFTGIPLFAGENEKEQLACIMEILNVPPREFLNHCKRKHVFFIEKPIDTGENSVKQASSPDSSLSTSVPDATVRMTPTTFPKGEVGSSSESIVASPTQPATMLVPLHIVNTRGRTRSPGTRTLETALKTQDPMFVRFVRKCLEWDPAQRWTCGDALEDPWLTIPAEPSLRSTGTKRTLPPI